MNKSDFKKAVAQTPRYAAFFQVVEVPNWASDLVSVGDEVYYSAQTDYLVTPTGTNIGLGCSYVKFLRYDKHPPFRW